MFSVNTLHALRRRHIANVYAHLQPLSVISYEEWDRRFEQFLLDIESCEESYLNDEFRRLFC